MNNNSVFERTIGLIGNENFDSICKKKILIFGLGGVGGTATVSLARCGFSNLTLVDFDVVTESNLNRQLLFNLKSVGKYKTDEAEKYILSINSSCCLEKFNFKIESSIPNEIKKKHFDFIVDAIDDVKGKIAISKFAEEANIPIIVSLGMANRFNPCNVEIIKLNKTTNDPLARKIRYEFKKNNIDISRINCVFSNEKPFEESNKLNSIITVPSSAGLAVCYYVIKYFLDEVK